MSTRYSAGDSVVRALRSPRAWLNLYGPLTPLVADSIERLAEGRADRGDLERLRPIAAAAGLDWDELYPELRGAP